MLDAMAFLRALSVEASEAPSAAPSVTVTPPTLETARRELDRGAHAARLAARREAEVREELSTLRETSARQQRALGEREPPEEAPAKARATKPGGSPRSSTG